MPRINVTDEELKLLEEVRRKHAQTLGYNEGIEIAAIQIETGAISKGTGMLSGADKFAIATQLRELKRELK